MTRSTDAATSKPLGIEQRLNALIASFDPPWVDFSANLNSAYVFVPASGFIKYRITLNNELQISAALAKQTTVGLNPATITSAALPSVPATTAGNASTITITTRGGHWFPVAAGTLAIAASPNNAGPRGTISTDGLIVICGVSTNDPNAVAFEALIPLDV